MANAMMSSEEMANRKNYSQYARSCVDSGFVPMNKIAWVIKDSDGNWLPGVSDIRVS